VEWKLKRFEELTTTELYEILRVRAEVFVVEQTCIYQDLDNLDRDAFHLWLEDDGNILSYCRILAPGVKFSDASSIGRVISSKRALGYGKRIVDFGIEQAKSLYKEHPIRIEAQKYAEDFYKKCGFTTVSGIFLVDGIDHVEMFHP
jgi:ElaA protein